MANLQDTEANISWLGEIVERIKKTEGLKFDTDVARLFGVDKTTIGKWKSRGTVPYDYLVNYARQKGYTLDWLLLGEGPMYREEVSQIREAQVIPYKAKQIEYDLFNAVAAEVRAQLQDKHIRINDPQMQAKIDYMITFVYNSMVKCDEHTVDAEQVRTLIKMIE